MKVKEESEKVGLKLNIQKSKIKASGSISLLSKGVSGVFFSTTIQKHQFFDT